MSEYKQALYDAQEYLIAGLENQAEWWEHLGDAHRDYAELARAAVSLSEKINALESWMRDKDTIYREAADLRAALRDARPYVYGVACEHRDNWRGETAAPILLRIDTLIRGGDPVEVHPSDSLAESQAELNGPGGSPTSPPRPDFDPHIDYPERYTDGPV